MRAPLTAAVALAAAAAAALAAADPSAESVSAKGPLKSNEYLKVDFPFLFEDCDSGEGCRPVTVNATVEYDCKKCPAKAGRQYASGVCWDCAGNARVFAKLWPGCDPRKGEACAGEGVDVFVVTPRALTVRAESQFADQWGASEKQQLAHNVRTEVMKKAKDQGLLKAAAEGTPSGPGRRAGAGRAQRRRGHGRAAAAGRERAEEL
eukprot:TRINITY_DN33215_c0_g1_i1.p1 TRINITY_DN33215_c0_g1~~TRINITY_DN33215_c0_g1_i1.p1  ORF type:complete len:235 (+),score=51.38 TRINITY_DN33215_c0_g1_i1:89-706(+)